MPIRKPETIKVTGALWGIWWPRAFMPASHCEARTTPSVANSKTFTTKPASSPPKSTGVILIFPIAFLRREDVPDADVPRGLADDVASLRVLRTEVKQNSQCLEAFSAPVWLSV